MQKHLCKIINLTVGVTVKGADSEKNSVLEMREIKPKLTAVNFQ